MSFAKKWYGLNSGFQIAEFSFGGFNQDVAKKCINGNLAKWIGLYFNQNVAKKCGS